MRKLTVTVGIVIQVETDEQAFKNIGLGNLQPGQTIVSPEGEIVKIEGIGFGFGPEENTKVLWCSKKDLIFYYYPVFQNLNTI
ncbi:MAG: hypothetical protein PHT24_07865 [Endomicrobiaceae bacterium]|nr:hypothetical protein [Endomicrobiaceae bacterium]